MATLARRSQRSTNIWPGFVDALATLLMVIIFLLMVFVLAQFFLNDAISGRDVALQEADDTIQNLQTQVAALAETLSMERTSNAELSAELQASVALTDDLNAAIEALTLRSEGAEDMAANLVRSLEEAGKTIEEHKRTIEADQKAIVAFMKTIEEDRRTIEEHRKIIAGHQETIAVEKEKIVLQLNQIATLNRSIAALKALKKELESNITSMAGDIRDSEAALIEERELSESARAQIALLNQQTAALRRQLAQLSSTLQAYEELAEDQKVQITSLGKRLNAALATKVQELSRYRSEFFGRLREVLGEQKGIHIVGDRFVFQSEVLFESGSADIGEAGQMQLSQLALSLSEIAAKIPTDIDWILRVDGHTDQIPIYSARYPSNWELSAARAISVVNHLIGQGISPNRLVAAGFGEHQPLDLRGDEIANRRNRRIELKLTQR